jgi:hypothetical protein
MNNKNLIIGGVVVAGIVAYYLYNKNKSRGGISSAPTGTASSRVENMPTTISGDSPIFVAPNAVAPKQRTEEIVTASVPNARPIDVIVNPIYYADSKIGTPTYISSVYDDSARRRNINMSNEEKAKDITQRAEDAFLGRGKEYSPSNPFLKVNNYGR